MKHTKPLLITCILFCCSTILVAQQGNVAAGGDASGSGGFINYSVGQTDYLVYSSEQATLSFGLQHAWFESTIVVPPTLEVQNFIVAESESICFNATETVTIAGEGTWFNVDPGGSVEVIAGQNILLKYGTNIHSGAEFHAWITIDGEYCNMQTSLLASSNEEVMPEKQPLENESMDAFLKVYPNPTNGNFTLDLLDLEEQSNILLEIYTMQGHLILSNVLPFKQRYLLSLAERQPGIYLIRILINNEIGITKIIKQ